MALDDIDKVKSKKKRKRSRSRSKSKKKKKKKDRSRSKSEDKKKKKKKKEKKRDDSSDSSPPRKKQKAASSDSDFPALKSEKKKKHSKKKSKESSGPVAGVFAVGNKVVVRGLRSTPKFNGAIGVITDKADGDRWPVKITKPEKKHFAIKSKNLEHYDPKVHTGVVAKSEKTEKKKTGTQPIAFIGEWFVYKKDNTKYYYNSRTQKTTWTAPAGEEKPMNEFRGAKSKG